MLFLRIKSRKSLLFIVGCSFCISLLLALIHSAFIINIYISIIGLSLSLSGAFLHFRNQNIAKDQIKLIAVKQIIPPLNNHKKIEPIVNRTVNTNGASYNENIGRDYVGRDLVTKNITLEGQRVEISSDYSQTLGDFKDILNEMIVQSSNAVEAISQFGRELAEELRKNPEIKVNLNAQVDSSEQELVNNIIIDLLTKSYDEISQIHQIVQTSQITRTNQLQRINNSRDLEYIEYCIASNEIDRDTREYNEYTIYLAKDHENMWHVGIKRKDDSSLHLSKQRRFSSKDNAIGTAKKKIDKDRMLRWKISGNTSG